MARETLVMIMDDEKIKMFANLLSDSADDPVEREAKIFEAGDYEDKGISVTEADLDRIIANHQPVPIGYEHAGGRLRFGVLSHIWRKGKEVFGRLLFRPEAWKLIQECNLNKLSVNLYRDKSRFAGVDLVENPRIADAQVFSFSIAGFNLAENTETEVKDMADEIKTEQQEKTLDPVEYAQAVSTMKKLQSLSEDEKIFADINTINTLAEKSHQQMIEMSKRASAMLSHLQATQAVSTVAQFKMDGKISKAAEPYALAILSKLPVVEGYNDDTESPMVTFSVDGEQKTMHIAEAFKRFLELMPSSIQLREMAKMSDEVSPETAEMLAKFGYTVDDYKKYGGA